VQDCKPCTGSRAAYLQEEQLEIECDSDPISRCGPHFSLRLYADAESQQGIRLLMNHDARPGGIAASSQRISLSWNTADAYVLPD
jgi:hypothetical protein